MATVSGIILTISDRTVWGNKRVHTCYGYLGNGTDTWPPTAGVQCPPSNFGLQSVEFVNINGVRNIMTYDYNSSCLQLWAYASASNTVVGSGIVPTSGQIARFQVIGTGLA